MTVDPPAAEAPADPPIEHWRVVLLQIRLAGLISGDELLGRVDREPVDLRPINLGPTSRDPVSLEAEHPSLPHRQWSATRLMNILDLGRRAGWLIHHEGRLPGWNLTAAGRVEGERLLADELQECGGYGAVWSTYREFRDLNRRFLDVCTDWQLRSTPASEPTNDDPGVRVTNDHTDSAWDQAVIGRLESLHAEIGELLRTTSAAVPRFASYAGRFATALQRVVDGEWDWLTRPSIDSYHTVWFELHEDLLATLGLSRSSEHDDSDEDGAAGTRNP